ncbi:diguanylate cyclase (GGDEF) domain-containing protein [Desulfonatronum thiosulfatophilum]|uniref:diguanylate cyclase n=1 Tax=Desulfonatronum thiosulfatophilum TaxID=617002 RepID=A0A1G6D6J7_9BACT|nr:diguanylate cyclase [Desulfonatronum thiosulfatophilum]SDB40777.1 diguanylate cyclase (GGDEF) domain-containing protein [Desulfonatronum thiosulfatophilum]
MATTNSIESLAASLNKTFAPALVALVREIACPFPDFNRIAQFIKSDPVLTTNILALVNSPFYALNQKVLDLKRAAVILGTLELLKITLSVSLYQSIFLSTKCKQQNFHTWRKTIWSALVAQCLAERLCPEKADIAYLSALLMNISRLLQARLPNDRDHAALSVELLRQWDLPEEILEAISRHHDMDSLKEHSAFQQCVILGSQWSDLEMERETDPLELLRFKHLLQGVLHDAPGHDSGFEQLRESILRRFKALTELLNLSDQEADLHLHSQSMETTQRLFFLSLDLSQSTGGVQTLARIFQKHLFHQWNLQNWELGLAWPQGQGWTLFRRHQGSTVSEVQTFVPFHELAWTFKGLGIPMQVGPATWGELRIHQKDLPHETLVQLRQYAIFAALALERYMQRTAVLEEKAGMLDGLPVGVARLNESGEVVAANPSLLRLLRTKSIHGRDISSVLRAIGLLNSETAWPEFIRDESTRSISSLNCPASMTPDINTPCLYFTAHKFSDAQRPGILLLLEDIQDIAGLQLSMHKQRNFLKGLVNAMRDVILTVTPSGIITFTSKLLPAELVGRNLFSITTPAGAFAEVWDEHLLQTMSDPQEAVLFIEGGPAIPLELIFSPLPALPGEPADYLVVGRDLTTIRRLEEKLRQQAMLDDLTGLFNQRYFHEILRREISRALRNRHALSLIFCDMDRFKLINDTKGHQAGDEVLRNVGKIFRDTCRKGADFPARYGGDEFVILATESSAEQLAHLADRINKSVAETFASEISFSIGISEYLAGESAESFLSRADRASYSAKRSGGNTIVVTEKPETLAAP